MPGAQDSFLPSKTEQLSPEPWSFTTEDHRVMCGCWCTYIWLSFFALIMARAHYCQENFGYICDPCDFFVACFWESCQFILLLKKCFEHPSSNAIQRWRFWDGKLNPLLHSPKLHPVFPLNHSLMVPWLMAQIVLHFGGRPKIPRVPLPFCLDWYCCLCQEVSVFCTQMGWNPLTPGSLHAGSRPTIYSGLMVIINGTLCS